MNLVDRFRPALGIRIIWTLRVVAFAGVGLIAGTGLSGCATLSEHPVTLHQQRLTVLDLHQAQLAKVRKISVMVRNCPVTLHAKEALHSAIGSATNFEMTDKSSDVLTVECTTAIDREGGTLGASRPAAIGLVANLSSGNEVVWSARYFYRDQDLSSDVLSIKDRFEVGGGGVQFAALADLASAGFREIAEALGEARAKQLLAQ